MKNSVQATLTVNGVERNCFVNEIIHSKDYVNELKTKGYHVFCIRHSDEDWGEPCTIEKAVAVNFFGYLITDDTELINNLNAILDEKQYYPVNEDTLKIFY